MDDDDGDDDDNEEDAAVSFQWRAMWSLWVCVLECFLPQPWNAFKEINTYLATGRGCWGVFFMGACFVHTLEYTYNDVFVNWISREASADDKVVSERAPMPEYVDRVVVSVCVLLQPELVCILSIIPSLGRIMACELPIWSFSLPARCYHHCTHASAVNSTE